MSETVSLPESTFLILGGCGFIGRNLVSHLVRNKQARHIRIVDKVPPQVAWLNEEHKHDFESEIVSFKSANLMNKESCKLAFQSDSNVKHWDFVINCAGETKYGQSDEIYMEGIYNLSVNCATEASKLNVKRYVELSAGQMGSSDKAPHTEKAANKPWTFVGKFKDKVEKAIAEIPNLNYTIIRPALVYGHGDKAGLTSRLVVASLYKKLSENLTLLWNADMHCNTVHVEDVCRAIVFVIKHEETISGTYNVVDKGNSTQGSIASLFEQLFGIKVSYFGIVLSHAVDLSSAADDANDKHLPVWANVCRTDQVSNTPLSPYLDAEMIAHKHLYIDGEALRVLGFEYKYERLTLPTLRGVVDGFIKMGVFPRSLMVHHDNGQSSSSEDNK